MTQKEVSYIKTQPHATHIMSKNLVKGVSKRILNLFSGQETSNSTAPYCNETLVSSGFKDYMSYMLGSSTHKRKYCWNVICFAPPFSLNVKTCMGRIFLSCVYKYFMQTYRYRCLFKRHKLRISFGFTQHSHF